MHYETLANNLIEARCSKTTSWKQLTEQAAAGAPHPVVPAHDGRDLHRVMAVPSPATRMHRDALKAGERVSYTLVFVVF